MPGILSNLFGDVHDDQARAEHIGTSGEDWADEQAARADDSGSQGQSSDTEVGAEAHLDPTINVHHEASVNWENADGSEGSWTTSEDITLTADVDAAVAAVSHIEHNDFDA